MGSQTLTNASATTVSQSGPTVNLDYKTGLGLRTGGAGDSIGYISWPIPFKRGASIISARVVFYSTSMPENVAHTLTLQRLGVAWTASKVTWNTRPTTLIAGTKPQTKSGPVTDKTEWSIDITDWMTAVSQGTAWYGIQMKFNEAVARYFYAENHPLTQYRPRLEVTWADKPAIPTGLSPGAGRKVGVPAPYLKANFLDVSGSTALAAVRFQVHTADVWTAPGWDSGIVPWTSPEMDLANPPSPAPAFTPLTDGAVRYWRCQFMDGAGLWSDWSAATSFQYDTHGVLTLTSPPAGNPIIEDATPRIDWTFAGETQAHWQIIITHVSNGKTVLDWDSGKTTSGVNSITVPANKINEPAGTVYTLRLTVWDNKQRENTATSPAYVDVIRTFTFVPGATAPVTNLSVATDGIRPRAIITWQRNVMPDAFNIRRNGRMLAGNLDPDDIQTSGGTFVPATTWSDFNSVLTPWHISTGGGTLVRDTAGTPIIEGAGQMRYTKTWAASGADFSRMDNGPFTSQNRSGNGLTFAAKIRQQAGTPADSTAQILIYGSGADRAGPVVPLIPGTTVDLRASFEAVHVSAMQHITIEIRRANSTATSIFYDIDLIQQGTMTGAYQYMDNSASPMRDTVYTVEAVVNKVASGTNPSQTITLKSLGIWLRDPISGKEVVLVEADHESPSRTMTFGNRGAVLQGIGENAPKVYIHQSLGGLEGRLEGNLASVLGKTAQQWRDEYLALQSLSGRKMWLTVGDMTIQVLITDWGYEPRPLPRARFAVSFQFYQQDKPLSVIPLGS